MELEARVPENHSLRAARHGRGDLATKADLAALETRLTVRFHGAPPAMVAAMTAFTKL